MIDFDNLQLKFDLDLDEVEGDREERAISSQEARQISEAARQVFDQMRLAGREEIGKDWFDDYLKLIELGWPWRVACYMAWDSSPKINRWPKSIKELAEDVLGLRSPRAIFTWRKNYPAINMIVTLMKYTPFYEYRRDLIKSTLNSAINDGYKGFNDRKLIYEMLGDYLPKSKLEIGKSVKGDVSDKSDDELRKYIMDGKFPPQPSFAKNAQDVTQPPSAIDADGEGDMKEEEDAG